MMRFLIACLVFSFATTGMGLLRPSANKICGFDVPPAPQRSQRLCADTEVSCPVDADDSIRSQYYAMSIKSAPGFDLGCAPDNWRQACDPIAGKKILIENPRLDWDHLCQAVDWSALVYATPETIKQTLVQAGIAQVTVGSSGVGDMQYFYYSHNGQQWLIFRGTDWSDLCNEMTDEHAWIKHSPILDELGFHAGFYDATLSALSQITLDVRKPLYIAGHSLGGAAATIASMVLKRQGYNVKSVITFGQPQIMDAESVARLPRDLAAIPHIRVINNDDVVPTLFWLARPLDTFTQYGAELHVGINAQSPRQLAYTKNPSNTPHASIEDHDHCLYVQHVHDAVGCAKAIVPGCF